MELRRQYLTTYYHVGKFKPEYALHPALTSSDVLYLSDRFASSKGGATILSAGGKHHTFYMDDQNELSHRELPNPDAPGICFVGIAGRPTPDVIRLKNTGDMGLIGSAKKK